MAGGMTFVFQGLPEFEAAMDALVEAASVAARAAVADGAHLIELAAKQKLTMYSHTKNTPTPSPPGHPPAIIGGALRRSAVVKGPTAAAGGWEAQIGPTIVYARIQELGGDAGKGHHSHLPPRPYLTPAVDELIASGALSEAMQAAWAAAMEVG